MKNIINVAKGREKSDLILKNCKIVDVFNKTIIESNIAISDGIIAGFDKEYTGATEIDVEGSYVIPGLIDTHVHIESSMVSPVEYAKTVIPKGVTTVIADPHEIANVCGVSGLSYMLESASTVPLNILYMLPSCVPATPFENSGCTLDSDDTKKLIPKFLGLAEMMNYVGVVNCDDEVLCKIKDVDLIDGHAPLLNGTDLNAYISAGIKTDHECTTIVEAVEKISKGMYVHIREGTLSHDLKNLVPELKRESLRRCTFCTDDKFIGEIMENGSISNCISKSIGLGLDPIDAIVMSTLNAAECYNLKKLGAIAPGYIADLVISSDLKLSNISHVYKNGNLVAKNNVCTFENAKNIDLSSVTNTVHIPYLNSKFFEYALKDTVAAIRLLPDTILTQKVSVHPDSKMTKVCVIERHHNRNSNAIGFIENYGITNGAIATTIAHDSHNVIVAGDNDEDMALAVNSLGNIGGIIICSKGKVLKHLPLPIAGLMSDKSAEEVKKEHDELYKYSKELSVNPNIDPFLSLSFIALPVIPEIRITDKGLFDVTRFEFI